MPSKVMEPENGLRINRPAEAAFKVVIVGRDALTGTLLADALVHHLKCESITARCPDLLRILRSTKVDLVILSADCSGRAGSGFELARGVWAAYPNIPIVILVDQPVNDLVIRAFLSGARGVFNPQDSMEDFIDCVEHVRKGSIWAGKDFTDFFLNAFRSIPTPSAIGREDSPDLSARELQVVQCAVKGKTNRAIADELHLSEHTVKNYLFKAFEKLGVSSRVELLFYMTIRGHVFNRLKADQKAEEPES